LARLPPWLEALAEVEEEDVWFSRRSSDVPCKVEGSRVSCSEQQGEAQEEAQAVAGSEPHDKPARCTSGPSGGGESLPEYCKVLEQRVGQLYAALRNSEAARKRLASAGSEACEAPLGLSPPRASREVCCVCMDAPRECAFTPCGHRCICRLCGVTAVRADRRCPICRSTVTRLLRIVDP